MGIKCPQCQTENPDTQKFCGECATPLQSSKDIQVTETLETPREELTRGTILAKRYEIIEELGKGGMGRVYRVEDTKLKQEVALKLIRPEIAQDKKTIERFRNELKLAREIAHRNVCRMYDLNEEKGTHYITMEYVHGEDLKSLIKRIAQLPVGKSISLSKQICEGLTEAHRLGVIHRDLKSSNIMIDKEGNVRIMDFGIARSLEAKGMTGAGVIIGTLEYMSPEQVEGKEVDQRSDIYSLGVILYEMITGRLPFEGDTPFAIGMKHKSERPLNPKELNIQISDDLNRLILKCLEKDREDRYQSVDEVRSDLEKLEQGLPVTDRLAPKKKTLALREFFVQFQMKKLLIPALSVIAIAVIGLVIWSPWRKTAFVPASPEKPSIAVLPFDDLSPQKDQESFCFGLAESLINALTQIRELRVPAITSSSFVKEEGNNLQEIGRRLNVRAVLRGSVQKAENRVRITAQILSTDDEVLIWSKQYNKELKDLFSVQDEICLAIVNELRVNLLGTKKESLTKRYTENIEAYNLYLKGRYFWNLRTGEGLNKAIELFEEACRKDSSYALAYAGIADCYVLLPWYGNSLPKEAYTRARTYAQKALEIDDALAEAHNSLAAIHMYYDWDWKASEAEFRRSIELNPNYATSHQWYGALLAYLKRGQESIDEIKRATELDPLSAIINTNFADDLYYAHRYNEAIEQYQRTQEMFPNWKSALLGRVYVKMGLFEEALDVLEESQRIWKIFAYKGAGRTEDALKLARQLLEDWENRSQHEYIRTDNYAYVHFALEDYDEVIKALEKGYQDRNPGLLEFIADPLIDSFRKNRRFINLLKRMNLEPWAE